MDNPLVSLIVACHNAAPYLDACLSSLTEQTYRHLEILICDDASTDDSVRRIQEWQAKDSRIILIRNEQCMRAAAARNRCIEVAKGEYFAIQDADDVSMPNRITELVRCLEETKADFASSAAFLFEQDAGRPYDQMNYHQPAPKKTDFLWRLPFIHAATVFRAACVRDVGGYRVAEETRRGQDYDLFMRLYAAGYRGVNLDEPLYCIRADRGYRARMRSADAHEEYLVRLYGFRKMRLMPIGWVFALKPYAVSVYRKIFSKKKAGERS